MSDRPGVRDYWQSELNPDGRIPDSQRWFDGWIARAALARQKLAGNLDIPYGPDRRERLDVFHAPSPRGTLVFIHGGYWRSFGKEAQSWIAESFVRQGISVAIPSYPPAPAARLTQIVASVRRACAHLAGALLSPEERPRVVVAGHSAGAHLAACVLAMAEAPGGAPDGIVCISGLFGLLALLSTRMPGGMGWDASEPLAVSPLFMAPPLSGKVILAVGGEESWEFHQQSTRVAVVLRPAGRHH
jgi:arylformamidase